MAYLAPLMPSSTSTPSFTAGNTPFLAVRYTKPVAITKVNTSSWKRDRAGTALAVGEQRAQIEPIRRRFPQQQPFGRGQECGGCVRLDRGEHEFFVFYYQGPPDFVALQLFVKRFAHDEQLFGPSSKRVQDASRAAIAAALETCIAGASKRDPPAISGLAFVSPEMRRFAADWR